MQNVIIQRETVNFGALDDALRTALGELLIGINVGGEQVTVHLDDEVTPEQIDQVRSIVEDHDPTQLTPAQQAELERQQQLQQMREENAQPLDVSAYDEQEESIRQLVARVAWLEREITDLRGLRA